MSFSRFYLSDLQVHTPADAKQNYGNVGGPDPNPAFAERLIKAHAAAGVQVIAVTDHNRIDWYEVLREAGDKYGVTVFPGLEISVNGCHLLIIWERSDFAFAQRFLDSLWPPDQPPLLENREPRVVESGQVLDIARKAHAHHGLVFAPHATAKTMGLFGQRVCRNSKQIAQGGDILGFDVFGDRRADVLANPRTEFGDVTPRWFITTDTRSFDDVGKRATYLKLGAEPTLEGIRQAFIAAETRVRFPASLEGDWKHVRHIDFLADPTPTWPRIESVKIAGGFHDGLSVEFGPGLNAVIGGKGTGKSTLIEIIRYVLEAGEPVETELKTNRKLNFPANAEADISFRTGDGDLYVARRSGDTPPGRLLRGEKDTEVAVNKRIAVRVFGQREMRMLVDDVDRRRDFVASRIGEEWTAAKSREREILGEAQILNAQLQTVEQGLARLDELESELADLRERLERAKERGIEDLLHKSEAIGRTDRAIKALIAWPKEVRTATEALGKKASPPLIKVQDQSADRLNAIVTELAEMVATTTAALEQAITTTEEILAVPYRAWLNTVEEHRAQIAATLAELGIFDLDEISKDQQRMVEIEHTITKYHSTRKTATELETKRATVLHQLADIRRQQSRLVVRAARDLTAAVSNRVRVKVEAFADRQALTKLLQDAVKGQKVRGDQTNKLALLPPTTIAAAIRGGGGELQKLGMSPATVAALAALPPETVRRIEQVATPDLIQIEIDLGTPGAEKWTPIEQSSPGQRSMAMLTLSLLSGTEPLVIDQPEDDLDNRYIYDEVVKILIKVCRGRQVIVATHNANIPILGDAELILAFDAAASQSSVLACGGLEDRSVAEHARHILEGGDEAFSARHQRYQAAKG